MLYYVCVVLCRLVKSYRKFANPKLRLEEIVADAELQEKSLSEVERLVDALHEGCVQAEAQQRAKGEDHPGREKGAILRLSGVNITASSILKREEELHTLGLCLPSDPAARRRYMAHQCTMCYPFTGHYD